MENSFFYNIYIRWRDFFINSLNNSLIVSSLLNNDNTYSIDGYLKTIFFKTNKILSKVFNWINSLFHKSLIESYIINLLKQIKVTKKSDLFNLILTSIGSLFVFFSLISFFRSIFTIKTSFIFIAGILIMILVFLQGDKNKLFIESEIIKQVRIFFDYNA